MCANDPLRAPRGSYRGMVSILLPAIAVLVLIIPGPAAAAGIPGAKPVELGSVPLKVVENEYRADPMRRASKSWPVQPLAEGETALEGASEVVEGRIGRGPWRLFEGTFPEEGCRAPKLNEDGTTSLAICTGLDVSRPEDENVVLVQDGVLSRYRYPIAELPEPAVTEVALAPDGKRFAVLTEEGGGRSVHLVNADSGKDWKVAGGWTEPGNPVVASKADVVAFVARVGRDQAVLVVDAMGTEATVVRRARGRLSVHGLSPDGRRVVLVADTNDRAQLLLVDLDSSKQMVLSHRKSAVTSVAVHASGDAMAFAADVGGVCALYWADVTGRRRTELMASVDACYAVTAVDRARRAILYTETGGEAPVIRIHDRRRGELRYQVIKGCSQPALSNNGALMTVRCPKARMGAGGYLFVLPPPKDDD